MDGNQKTLFFNFQIEWTLESGGGRKEEEAYTYHNQSTMIKHVELSSQTITINISSLSFFFLLTAIIGDPKLGVKTSREWFDNTVKHSPSASAIALNLLENLFPKEIQRISKIKGTNGKTPLDGMILAAIKVSNQLSMYFVFTSRAPFRSMTSLMSPWFVYKYIASISYIIINVFKFKFFPLVADLIITVILKTSSHAIAICNCLIIRL